MDSEHEIRFPHTCGFHHTLNKSGIIFSYKLAVAHILLHTPFRGDKAEWDIAGIQNSTERVLPLKFSS